MIRLTKIASLTNGYDTLADIGSDHGFVCIKAIKDYNVKKAFACDINIGPLNNAICNIEKNNLTDKIFTVLSNGLNKLQEDVDVIVISGMGGDLIVDILNNDINKVNNTKCLILQGNSEVSKIREFAVNNDFIIKNEYIVFEKKHYYEILVLIKGQAKYNLLDIKYGPILRKEKSKLFIELYTKKLNILNNNISRINDELIKENINNQIEELKGVLYE